MQQNRVRSRRLFYFRVIRSAQNLSLRISLRAQSSSTLQEICLVTPVFTVINLSLSWEQEWEGYGVKTLIRVGTTGAISEDVHIRDLVFAMGACAQTNYVREFGLPGDFAPIADFGLLIKAVFHAEQENLPYHVGNVLTSDLFYEPEKKKHDGLQFADMGVLAVEMETAALYANAALAKARALSILTVSDSMVTGEKTTAEERETSFADMIHVALEIV